MTMDERFIINLPRMVIATTLLIIIVYSFNQSKALSNLILLD